MGEKAKFPILTASYLIVFTLLGAVNGLISTAFQKDMNSLIVWMPILLVFAYLLVTAVFFKVSEHTFKEVIFAQTVSLIIVSLYLSFRTLSTEPQSYLIASVLACVSLTIIAWIYLLASTKLLHLLVKSSTISIVSKTAILITLFVLAIAVVVANSPVIHFK